ncbi:MAG: YggT family protein [FCB group bacterium]|nr:YggT family protein [FCB group bacterium]
MIALIDFLFQILTLALLVRVVLSWIPHDPRNDIIQWLYRLTDPLIRPFQQLIPPLGMGIDLSPLLAFFALGILRKLIIWLLM